MANIKSAAKRARVSQRRRAINRSSISRAKSDIGSVQDLLKSGKKEEAQALYKKVQAELDKAAKVGSIHRNKASRLKSHLSKQVFAK